MEGSLVYGVRLEMDPFRDCRYVVLTMAFHPVRDDDCLGRLHEYLSRIRRHL